MFNINFSDCIYCDVMEQIYLFLMFDFLILLLCYQFVIAILYWAIVSAFWYICVVFGIEQFDTPSLWWENRTKFFTDECATQLRCIWQFFSAAGFLFLFLLRIYLEFPSRMLFYIYFHICKRYWHANAKFILKIAENLEEASEVLKISKWTIWEKLISGFD